VMNFETKVVNVNDEKNIQTPCVPSSLEWQIPMFGDDTMQMLELPHLLILIALELGHASYLMCKGNLIRS
jgi:hypothetical protein